jgi:hypothetical protein
MQVISHLYEPTRLASELFELLEWGYLVML